VRLVLGSYTAEGEAITSIGALGMIQVVDRRSDQPAPNVKYGGTREW